MAWRKWTRQRLTAPDVQEYLQDQVVLHFASASAADAALVVGDRTLGMVRFLDDVKRAEWWDTASDSWRYAFGNPPTAAVGFGGGVGNQSGFDPWRVWRDPSGGVRTTGTVSIVAFSGTPSIGIIPAGFRPPESTERVIYAGDSRTPQRVSIGTDGVVILRANQAWAGTYWSVDMGWIAA